MRCMCMLQYVWCATMHMVCVHVLLQDRPFVAPACREVCVLVHGECLAAAKADRARQQVACIIFGKHCMRTAASTQYCHAFQHVQATGVLTSQGVATCSSPDTARVEGSCKLTGSRTRAMVAS
jgi:hypothetical protein